jgi:hypothetical protein
MGWIVADVRPRPTRRPWRCWFRAHVWELAWWGKAECSDGDVLHVGECCRRCGKVRERWEAR